MAAKYPSNNNENDFSVKQNVGIRLF